MECIMQQRFHSYLTCNDTMLFLRDLGYPHYIVLLYTQYTYVIYCRNIFFIFISVKWRSSNNKNANSAEVPNNALSGTDNQNKEISQEKLSIVIPSPIYYNNVFKNREFTYANSEHSSSELLNNLSSVSNNVRETTSTINLTTVPSNNETNIYLNTSIISNRNQNRISGATRKVPQNLKLQNAPLLETLTLSVQPSPSLSTCSGPYIPISECFSGTSKYVSNYYKLYNIKNQLFIYFGTDLSCNI